MGIRRTIGGLTGGRRVSLLAVLALASAGLALVAEPGRSATGGSPAMPAPAASYAVGLQVLHLTDASRTITLPGADACRGR